MILVPNNDSSMINREELVVFLCEKMLSKEPIYINLNNEGPCAKSLGLYDLLDQLCEKYKYEKSLITIITCNLIETHSDYKIEINPQMMYLESAREFVSQTPFIGKKFDDKFRHFGNFIGHGNLHRLHIASYLSDRYSMLSLQTYHYRTGDEYHRKFVGIEDMLFMSYDISEINRAYKFLKSCPITLDQIDSYPILNPATLNITKVYPDFFIEIVNLTYFSGDTFYIDEKIWRPMIMKTPFLVQGPQNFINNLKKLGFKTFDRWWDEGYSEDPERSQIDGILQNIDSLSQLSLAELKVMYSDMQSVLEHNYQRCMEIRVNDFFSVCQQ